MSDYKRFNKLIRQYVEREFSFELVEVKSFDEIGPTDADFSGDETRFKAKVLLAHSPETIASMVSSADPAEAEEVALFYSEPTQLLLIIGPHGVIRSEMLNIHLS